MTTKLSNFLNKATLIHKNKYSYKNTIFTDWETKITITCLRHGDFVQSPKKHVYQKTGCPICGIEKRNMVLSHTLEDFLRTAAEVHGARYNYNYITEYKNNHTKLPIECTKHGIFLQTANKHIHQRCGCPKCVGRNMDTDLFIEKALMVHGSKYNYDNVVYISSHKKVTIICKQHGNFKQTPNNHLQGYGCALCGMENDLGAYCDAYFKKYPLMKDTPATLYIVKFSNVRETFFKVGITKNSLKKRFSCERSFYKIEPIIEAKMPLELAFRKEQKILKAVLAEKYIPLVPIGGKTECFSYKGWEILTETNII